MISPELLRRYPFFAGLSHENIATLAGLGREISAEAGFSFFREGEELHTLYLTVEGAVGIVLEVPNRDAAHTVSDQFTRTFETKSEVLSTAGPGQVFGWSALLLPYETFAGAKALTPCRVITFDCVALRKIMKEDCDFGYVMMENTAKVIRQRLRNLRIESLALMIDKPVQTPEPVA